MACIDATGIPASQRWGVQCGEVGMKLPEVPAAAFGQSKEPAGITHGRLDSQHTGFLRFALSPHLPGQLWIRDWATRDWAGLAEAAVECRCHTLVTPWPRHPETGWKQGPPGSSQQGPVVQRVGNPLSLCSCSWWDFKAFTRPDSDRGLRSSRMSHSFLPIF